MAAVKDCPAHYFPIKVPKMNPDIKAKWVEALLSEEYPQCKGVLHSENGGYCCLGVLSHLYPYGRWAPSIDCYTFHDDDTVWHGAQSRTTLTKGVRLWSRVPLDAVSLLSAANDGCEVPQFDSDETYQCNGHSFKEIAAWIEEFL